MRKTFILIAIIGLVMVSFSTSVFAASIAFPSPSGANKLEDEFTADGKNDDKKAEKKADKKDIAISVATKTEYKAISHTSSIKHEGKVYMNAVADDIFTIQAGLNYETKVGTTSESEKWEMENMWLQGKISRDMVLRYGRQTYHLAKGIFMDQDGVLGGRMICKLDEKNTAETFIGRDSQDVSVTSSVKNTEIELVEVLNFTHKFDKGVTLGSYVAKQGTVNKFWAGYGKIEVAPKTNVNFEYVKNNYNSKKAYIAELQYGSNKKIGGATYALEYMNFEKQTFETNNYTDFDTQWSPKVGFKGPGAIINTRISKAGTLQAQQWWGQSGVGPITKVTMVVRF